VPASLACGFGWCTGVLLPLRSSDDVMRFHLSTAGCRRADVTHAATCRGPPQNACNIWHADLDVAHEILSYSAAALMSCFSISRPLAATEQTSYMLQHAEGASPKCLHHWHADLNGAQEFLYHSAVVVMSCDSISCPLPAGKQTSHHAEGAHMLRGPPQNACKWHMETGSAQ